MNNHPQTIRLGIIGAGKVTTNPDRHIDSIRSLKDQNVEITAIADVLPDLARQVAEDFSIPLWYEDYHQMLANPDIHAVTINTPTATHKQIALDCIHAGKHLYIEKPITMTAKELEEVLAAARQSDKVFLAGSNGLLQRQMGMFRKLIANGSMGQVYLVSVDRASSRSQEYGMDSVKEKKSTGISSHSGSHNVEWALYLLGDPKPISVQARGFYKTQSLSLADHMDQVDDDTCVATVNFDNGAMFLFKAFRAAPTKDMYQLTVYGDKMSLSYDVTKCYKEKSDDCIRFYRHDPVMGMQEIAPKFQCGKTHADMYRHFFECIRENKPSISNGQRGLVTMKILDAMEQSIRQMGKQISL